MIEHRPYKSLGISLFLWQHKCILGEKREPGLFALLIVRARIQSRDSILVPDLDLLAAHIDEYVRIGADVGGIGDHTLDAIRSGLWLVGDADLFRPDGQHDRLSC